MREKNGRIVTVAAVAATVLVGFAGSMTAAQAMTSGNPLLDLDLPLPILTTPMPAAQPATELTVTYRADAKAAARTMHLECGPTGGDHPRAEDACAALAAAAGKKVDPFAPVPRDQICTFIYGGPQVALVQGDWNGRAVDARFTRTNGCEISRWDAIEAVLTPDESDAGLVQ